MSRCNRLPQIPPEPLKRVATCAISRMPSRRSSTLLHGADPQICAGHTVHVTKRNLMHDEAYVDPNFFADDYTVAAATGFQVLLSVGDRQAVRG